MRQGHRGDRSCQRRPGHRSAAVRTDCIDIREGSQPLEFCICGPDETGRMVPLPFQNLLLFTPFHPEAEHPYGVSLMRSLPFLTDILMKIYHTVGVNWER